MWHMVRLILQKILPFFLETQDFLNPSHSCSLFNTQKELLNILFQYASFIWYYSAAVTIMYSSSTSIIQPSLFYISEDKSRKNINI